MKKFRVHWLSQGSPTIVEGPTITDAMNSAGFGRGVVAAIDYYEEIFDFLPQACSCGEDLLKPGALKVEVIERYSASWNPEKSVVEYNLKDSSENLGPAALRCGSCGEKINGVQVRSID